jgi:hypothetical protein
MTGCTPGTYGRSRRRHAAMAAALLILLLAWPAGARAQTIMDSHIPDPATAQMRVGPFGVNPGVVFSSGYDTNPYREAGSGSDVETYVVPQFDAALALQRLRSQAYAAIELVHFQNRNGARNYQFGTRNEWQGFRVMPFFEFNQRHTNANPTGFEVGRKSLRIENDLRTGARAALGARVFASAYYRWTKTNWDADAIYQASSLREKLNRTDTAIGAGIEFELTPLTTLRFGGDTNDSTFVYSPIRNGGGYRIGPGITIEGPAAITGNVDIGMRSFKSTTSGVNFNGMISNISVSRLFPTDTFVAFRFDRDLQFSYSENLEYFVGRTIGVTIMQALGENIAVQSFYNHNTLTYAVAEPGVIPINAVDEYGFAIGRRFGRTLKVGTSAEWAKAAGNQPWKEFRMTVFLTYGFGGFQRLDRPVPFQR